MTDHPVIDFAREILRMKGEIDEVHEALQCITKQLSAAHKVIEDLLLLVDTELTPNVRHIALQNYQLLNEAPMNARRLLESP